MAIHPTAIIHPDAELAEDTEVQAYTIIGPGVRVGARTIIGPHCVMDGRTEIGEDNRFFSGAQIGVLSQDLKHRADLVGRTTIGNGNVFREHFSVSASTVSSEDDEHRVTSIGDNCLFMTCAHVAHDCHLGNQVIMANNSALAGHVDMGNNATVGGLSAIHQECRVGAFAFVGGMARIVKDVPPYMIVEGNPAVCCGLNAVGLQRNGFDEAARKRIKALYKLMYRSNLNTTQAVREIENSVEDSEERNRFLEFIRTSSRGIIK